MLMGYKPAMMVLLAIVLTSAWTATARMQSSSVELRGAWTVTQALDGTGKSVGDASRPSLFIFTARHYSVFNVHGDRPHYRRGQATPEQKVATFDAFSANGGTYQANGNKMTMVRTVAKNLHVEGTRSEVEYRIAGKVLTLIYPQGEGSFVLTRVE
jgi:hypothetical protein